jgi:toxin ParE1/3/4
VIRLVLRPGARQDLTNIWHYTADQWGMGQADSYVGNIERELARALAHPAIGSPVEGLPHAYRKLTCGKHRVIYRYNDAELIVVRIIHERQDVPSEFDDI